MSRARSLGAVGAFAAMAAAYACGGGDPSRGVSVPITSGDAGEGPGSPTDSGASSSSGDPAAVDSGLPPTPSNLAVGSGFACVQAQDGSVSCWGRNDLGQLGRDPVSTPSCGSYPCTPTPTKVPDVAGVVKVAAGDDFACALEADRTLWCWGSNASGQLETTSNAPSDFHPRRVLVDVIDVVAAGAHACARGSDELVRCWGENTCKMFGDIDAGVQKIARILPNVPKMSQVSLSRDAICGISLIDGHVLCWGTDHQGSLGHATASFPCNGGQADPVPRSVLEASDQLPIVDIAEVRIGDASGCARRKSGQIVCWGDNARGELGQGVADSSPHPQAIDVPSVSGSGLAVGGKTACAIVANRLLCWGDSTDGQLEILSAQVTCSSQSCRALGYVPTGMQPVHHVAIGPTAIGAIKDDATLWMWGQDSSGELALPSSDPSTTACPGGRCVAAPKQVTTAPALD